ncbi:carbohydrate ABC transporter permease [Muricomes intestini]|jgi:multiple sugar transport system permease protein|uniref:Carbohydrate ABC transporter membrane protein 2 (CUT1 family) n=1 Tax=Muricomes intestini TaxID=1796634 RepID=A0A4R3KAY8_9FIRM|nr:carbohydrate ABC transporter permease [Muricomes intestini]TCS80197.1 carbohydrate ABC transporter membrane protein 2 (CUT1 family) [Muricomes intestini]HAX52380.1 carbohydrate ABC transporter permease [Lachnospiraceae bacterium]HCR82117.1 carbohydrate ABC transporter permease [Lachnospiraceae bacterium]
MENQGQLVDSSKNKKIFKILEPIGRNLGLTLFAMFALFPLVWMVVCAFKSDAQMYNTVFIFHPTLENFRAVLVGTDYFRAFFQNLVVAGGAVIITVIAGVPCAYALARYNFKKKEDVAFQILSFKFAPEILVILPIFLIFQKIGLYDTYFGLIWVYQLITMPLLIWVVRGYFEDISIEVEQAAQLDGYTWYEVFFKTLVPLIKPGLVASALLAFIFAWNSFTFPLILSGFEIQTITITALRYIASDTVHYGQVAVASTIAVLPEVIVALFIQKHLVRGLSFGAVKG